MEDETKNSSSWLDPATARARDDAFFAFWLNRTVPIFQRCADVVKPLMGSGTLFTVGGRHYLISAAHVFDAPDFDHTGLPETPKPKAHLVPLSGAELIQDRKTDVALVGLDGMKEFPRLMSREFLLPSDLASVGGPIGQFLFGGFPYESAVAKDGGSLVGTPSLFVTPGLEDNPHWSILDEHGPPNRDIDLYLAYDKQRTRTARSRQPLPKLEGLSGTSIFVPHEGPDGLWHPNCQLKVCAILVATLHGRYARCRLWKTLVPLFEKVDRKAAEQVADALEQTIVMRSTPLSE